MRNRMELAATVLQESLQGTLEMLGNKDTYAFQKRYLKEFVHDPQRRVSGDVCLRFETIGEIVGKGEFGVDEFYRKSPSSMYYIAFEDGESFFAFKVTDAEKYPNSHEIEDLVEHRGPKYFSVVDFERGLSLVLSHEEDFCLLKSVGAT